MSMRKVLCPSCRQFLEHDRGYLPTHMTDLVRGNLTTGSKVCDASNKKIITDLLTVEYTHTCRECGVETEIKLTEDYPGAMEQREPFIEMDCFGCTVSHDGYYCANEGCGTEVKWHDDEWHITEPGVAETKVVYSEAEADAYVAAWRATAASVGTQVAQGTSAFTVLQNQLAAGGLDPVEAFEAALLQIAPPDGIGVVYREAGWYKVNPHGSERFEGRRCDSDDPTSTGEHRGVFKAEFHRKVLVSDGHIIHEEPDGFREEEEDTLSPSTSQFTAPATQASPRAALHKVELWHDTTTWKEGFEYATEPADSVNVASDADADALEAWVEQNYSLRLARSRPSDQVFFTRRHAAYLQDPVSTLATAQASFTSTINAWTGI